MGCFNSKKKPDLEKNKKYLFKNKIIITKTTTIIIKIIIIIITVSCESTAEDVFHLNAFIVGFHPWTHKLELHTSTSTAKEVSFEWLHHRI